MRSLALFCELAVLLPIAMARPFVGVILWSWVSFMNPHRLVYGGISVMTPWAMLIFFATMIGCLMAREPKRFPWNAVTISITLFLVMICVTTVFAVGPPTLVWDKFEAVFKVYLFLLVTAALTTSKERVHALIWVMVLSLGFFGIKGGMFTLVGGGSNRVFGPPNSMIFDNNHLAVGMLVSLPLMNYLRLESAHRLIRLGLSALMVLTLFAVVGSYSRGALLALGAVGFYFWCKSSKKILSGIVIVVMLASAIHFMPEKWMERMNSIETYQEDQSATTRLKLWNMAWVLATSNPLTGVGFYGPYSQPVVDRYVSDVEARAVHSIWFETLAEQGFPTFFVWLGITISGAILTRIVIKRAANIPDMQWCVNLAKMAQVSIIAYVSGGTFLSLGYWDFYFTVLVAVSAMYELVKAARAQEVQSRRRLASMVPSRVALSR
jgi:putative inorganic carbon (hco3(-)) transporter